VRYAESGVSASTVPDLPTWWTQYRDEYEHRTWRDYRILLSNAVKHGLEPPLLDVGCGYGFLVECARQFGIPAVGLEASTHALGESRRRHPSADIREWHAGTRLPFDAESIGVAMLNQVVDHFTLDENQHLMHELRRVLKPDGTLLVYSPSRHNRFESDTGHLTFFSPAEFRRFVAASGFTVVAQPYQPQPLLGQSGVGWLLMRALTHIYKRETWAATIDLVAARRDSSG
jgi:SAM-dependent methyltransferase